MAQETEVRLESRLARLEGSVEQMDRRLGNVKEEVRDLRREIRRLYSIVIAMWVTIVLAIFSAAIMVLTAV